MDKMDEMETNTFFSGSANVQYKPTTKMELGFGSSTYHSISAMKEYKNFSTEEIRIEDYNASSGLFGSAIAKIGGALCVEAKHKWRPHLYGELYRAAIASEKIQPLGPSQDSNFCAPAPINLENKYQKSSVIDVSTVIGKDYWKISINGPFVNGINLSVKDKSNLHEDEERKATVNDEEKKVKYGKSPVSKMRNKFATERKEFQSKTYKKSIIKESKSHKTPPRVPLHKTSEESKKRPGMNKGPASNRQNK